MAGQKGRSGGQNRKTTKQHHAEGTLNATRHRGRVDAQVANAAPMMPSTLGEVGQEVWRRYVAELPAGAISRLDRECLTAFCEAWEMLTTVTAFYRDDPLDKDLRLSYSSLLDRVDRLGRQLGWSPQSRAGIQLPAKQEESEFEKWLKAGRDD